MTDPVAAEFQTAKNRDFVRAIDLRRIWPFVVLWLVAFSARIVVAIPFLQSPIALDDMFQYDMLARSIVQGNGYRWYSRPDLEQLRPYLSQFLDYSKINVPENGLVTTFRPPGYPFFLAGIYRLVPLAERLFAARIAQSAFDAFLAPLVFLLAVCIGLRRKAAFIAGIAVGFYPLLLLYPIALASENLFIPLVLCAFVALMKAARSDSLWLSLLAGVLLGLAMLTRSVVALFVLLTAVWLGKYARKGWRSGLVVFLVAFGICIPWAVRNSLIMGKPTFLESSMGYQMYIGYHPDGTGSFVSKIAIQPLSILDDTARDAYTTRAAIGFIRANPREAALRIVRRAVYFFMVEDRELTYFYTNNFFGPLYQPWLTMLYLLIILPWIGVCLGAPMGIWAIRRRPEAALAVFLVIAYTLPHLLIIAEPRFHLALVPILIPFSVRGWMALSNGILWLKRPSWKRRSLNLAKVLSYAGLAIVIFGLIGLWAWGFSQQWHHLLMVLGPGGNLLRQTY